MINVVVLLILKHMYLKWKFHQMIYATLFREYDNLNKIKIFLKIYNCIVHDEEFPSAINAGLALDKGLC